MRLLSLSEVSIQKRTSPDKFTWKLGIRDLEISFAFSLVLAFELTSQSVCAYAGLFSWANYDSKGRGVVFVWLPRRIQKLRIRQLLKTS